MDLKVYDTNENIEVSSYNIEKEFYIVNKDSDRYDLVKDGKLKGKITCKLELGSVYGDILRCEHFDSDKVSTRVQISDADDKVASLSQRQLEREWVVESVKACGFEVQNRD